MANLPDPFENRLQRELKSMFAPPTPMGNARDNVILAAAHHAGTAASRWKYRVAWAMGVAAALSVTAGLLWPRPYERIGDIRDAFYVAREIKTHQTLDKTWDTNKDGVVDEKDVRALALAAVKLDVGKGVTR